MPSSYVFPFISTYTSLHALFYSNEPSVLILISFCLNNSYFALSLAIIHCYNFEDRIVLRFFELFCFYILESMIYPLTWALFSNATRPYGTWIVMVVAFITGIAVFEIYGLPQKKSCFESIFNLMWAIPVGFLFCLGYSPIFKMFDNHDDIGEINYCPITKPYLVMRVVIFLFMIFFMLGMGNGFCNTMDWRIICNILFWLCILWERFVAGGYLSLEFLNL